MKLAWYCLCFSSRLVFSGQLLNLDKSLKYIFGNDLHDYKFIDDENFDFNEDTDFYVFVKCKNIENHIKRLRQNKYLKNILNNYNDIIEIPEEEITGIKSKGNNIVDDGLYKHDRSGFFTKGDIVQIKNGPYSDLIGVVIDKDDEDEDENYYKVFFRLFIREFTKSFSFSNLIFKSSLFKYKKFPVVNQKKRYPNITKKIKLYEKILNPPQSREK